MPLIQLSGLKINIRIMAKKDTGIAKVVQPTMMPIVLQPRDHSSKNLDSWKAARALAQSIYNPIRKPLIDLYEDVEIDSHVITITEKRILPITRINWTFTAKGEPFEPVAELTDKLFFEKILKYIIESKIYGGSLIEVDFKQKKCELVPRGHVVAELNAVLPEPYNVSSGIDFTQPPFNRTSVFVGELWDLGRMFSIAPWVLLKRGDVGDWATFCEVFGMPSRVYFYDPNIPGNYEAVTKQAAETGANAWAVLPLGSDMKQEAGGGKQGSDNFKLFADFCNSEMSKAMLGQTMTTESGSSYSQSQTHGETEDDINDADRKFVERVLNEMFIPLLIAQGFDIPPKGRFHAVDEVEELTKQEQLDMDMKLHKDVAPLPLKHFEEKYNVKFDMKALQEKQKEAIKQKQQVQVVKPNGKIKLSDRLSKFLDFFV